MVRKLVSFYLIFYKGFLLKVLQIILALTITDNYLVVVKVKVLPGDTFHFNMVVYNLKALMNELPKRWIVKCGLS